MATTVLPSERASAEVLRLAADCVREVMQFHRAGDTRDCALREELRYVFDRIRPSLDRIGPGDLTPELWERFSEIKGELNPPGGPRAERRSPYRYMPEHRVHLLAADILGLASAVNSPAQAEHSGGTEPSADV